MVHPPCLPSSKQLPRVLLADDEESILFAVGHFLRARGYAVATAPSRSDAEATLAAGEFDIVITDLSFGADAPHGGLAVVEAARRRSLTSKILLLTAYGSREVESRALTLGAARVVTKPIPLSELEAILVDLLGADA